MDLNWFLVFHNFQLRVHGFLTAPALSDRNYLGRHHSMQQTSPMPTKPQLDPRLILVTPPSADVERDAVATAWADAGGEVVRVDRFWQPPELDPTLVRIYGPHTFALVLAEVWPIELVSPPYDLILGLPDDVLLRRMGSCRLDEVGALPLPLFVKPLVPKLFTAAVYDDPASIQEETAGLEGETMVVWSEPRRFVAEVRIFATGRAIHAASAYEGDVPNLDAATAVGRRVLENIAYDGPLVLDVGQFDDGRWAVIEVNEAWGAGLNGCDAEACVPVLGQATRPLAGPA